MAANGFSVETADLTRYSAHNDTMSTDIGTAAKAHLAKHLTLPGNLFGDLGYETGLHATVGEHIDTMNGHMYSLAGSVGDLGRSVNTAKGDYDANEENHSERIRSIL
ncbi:MAG: hypothetical protein JWQ81_5157 [Amycolatopsis sp.]|jgi:hypothetical protein|uniref:hypothetical protein n=1 Tax=Amycolatopsis sp. TaxID=37632 RepID=UPI00262762D3|nr:hypothetical protein [Amycolatopsis sp.]MCU1684418.1 hypothetical protein [Amycolatopsis sp.]